METLRIAEIDLVDVGPFSNLNVSFSTEPGINIICGDNGIGKSTLLESITALFSNGLLSRLKRKQAASIGRISADIVVNDQKRQSEVLLKEFEPEKQEYFSSPLIGHSRSIINIRTNRDLHYYPQQSIGRDPSIDPHVFAQRVAEGLNGLEIKSWFTNRFLLQHHAQTAGWTQEMMDNLASAISFFSLLDPFVKLDRVDVKTFEIIVSTPSGLIPFEYLSSGFRSAYTLLLGILKEIEFRGLGVAAKNFSGIILIDEIDLHLHPTWQREIAGVLKEAFPKAQIIASTHSPHIIQAAQASEVIALTREEDGSVHPRIVQSTRFGYAGWTLEEVLEDIMGVEDTKTPIFREEMRKFDDAIDRDDADAVVSSLNLLREMLHPKNPTRKLIEIQAAPYIGATTQTEGEK